jgi:hypothetical protein
MAAQVHVAATSTAGRSTAVALCGRLVGRMNLASTSDHATCPKCATEALIRETTPSTMEG